MPDPARLNVGIQLHRAGRLAEAEQIYRQILTEQPDHAEVCHLCGVLEGQRGNTDQAIELLRRSVELNPTSAEVWRNLGSFLSEKGRFREAGAEFQQVLSVYRRDCAAHRRLGAKFAAYELFQQAIGAFNEAIRIKPTYAEAYNDLGNLLAIQNKVDESIAAHEKAIELEPGFAEAHYALGNLLSRKGQMEAALLALKHSSELNPQLVQAHLNLGNMLRQLGRVDEAIAAYLRAIDAKADSALAYFNIGQALQAAGRLPESLSAFAHALRAKPNYLKAQLRMAIVLARLSRFDEAREAQSRTAKLSPKSAEVWSTLGEILVREQRAADAESHFRRALEIDPNFEPAWNGLGNALESLGRFEEASVCYRRALQLSPDDTAGFGYRSLSSTTRLAAEPADLDRLRAILSAPDSPSDNRAAAGFALGKMLDDVDRYEEAFAAFARANDLYKKIRASTGDVYRPEVSRQNVDRAIEMYTPQYFQTHSNWGTPSELPVFVVGMPRSGTTLIHQIAARHTQTHGAGERTDMRKIAEQLKNIQGASQAKAVAHRYLDSLATLNPTASRIVDKNPDNVNLLGIIATLFPGSRVILCRRNARDTCLSCYFQWFSTGNTFAFDLEHCAQEFRQVDRLMTHWLTALPIKMLEMHYEDLVTNQECESRRLIDFLDLPWDPACLEFQKAETTVLTASLWQVRQPIYQSSIGRWRNYEKHLGPLLRALADKDEGLPTPDR